MKSIRFILSTIAVFVNLPFTNMEILTVAVCVSIIIAVNAEFILEATKQILLCLITILEKFVCKISCKVKNIFTMQ